MTHSMANTPMTSFNGVEVSTDDENYLRFTKAGEDLGVLSLPASLAAVEWSRGILDENLGRWRSKRRPDYLVYPPRDEDPESCDFRVLRESDGEMWWAYDHDMPRLAPVAAEVMDEYRAWQEASA